MFCPREKLKKFTDDCPEPDVYSKKITHKDKSEETIYIMMHDLEKYICAEMKREIESTYKSYPRSRSDPMLFGYALLSSKIREGIYTLLGTDHGQEFCQFVIRFLLGTPEDRRATGCADHQTKTMNFCTIKCKKDTQEILEIMKENVNKALTTLNTKQMVGIEDGEGAVKTVFVEKNLTLINVEIDPTDENFCVIKCEENGRQVEIKTGTDGLDTSGELKPFKIIEWFHNFQCGDYAAQFSLQGRPGKSSCRCMHCNLTHTEWNDMDVCTKIPRILTYDDIKEGKNSDVGNSKPPTYGYNPLDCLSPVLHGEIGSGNSQIDSSLVPLLIDIDSATEEEYRLLTEQHELDCRIESVEEGLSKMMRITDDEVLNELKRERAEWRKKKRNAIKKLTTAKNSKRRDSEGRVKNYSEVVNQLEKEVESAKIAVETREKKRTGELEHLKSKKKKLKENRKAVSAKIDLLRLARKRKGVSLVAIFHGILQRNRITVKAWHGGSLTGGHVIKLLRRSGEVMKELSAACDIRIQEREDCKEFSQERPIPSKDYVNEELRKHEELLKMQDYVYSSLRLIHPTEEEENMTEFFMDILKEKWKAMGLSTTCKMHFNFDHICDQQKQVKGLGDKCEDWLEREHQKQLKYNRITFGMMPKAALKLQAKLKWRENNPYIREQIKSVHAKFSNVECGNLSVAELETAAKRINKSWKEKYGSRRKLKRKYVSFQGARGENVNS